MPEKQLQDAVQELHAVVLALKELLEREYPRRDEIERRYLDKYDLAAKTRKNWIIVAVMGLVMLFTGFFASVTTVSYCFLGSAQDGGRPVCEVIPGYEQSLEVGKQRLKIFEEMIGTMERNERRINRLERQLRQR